MSASRCLLPFAKTIIRTPIADWKPIIAALPEQCPHDDCNAPKNCRQRCRDFAVAQWRIRGNRAKAKTQDTAGMQPRIVAMGEAA